MVNQKSDGQSKTDHSRVKLVCFSFFVIRHSSSGEVSLFFVFRYSLFVFRFSTFELGPNFVF